MKDQIPGEAPEEPETWQEFMKDMETIIMPGVSSSSALRTNRITYYQMN